MLKNGLILSICFIMFASCQETKTPLFTMDMETEIDFGTGENTIETHYKVKANVNTFFSSYSDNTPEALASIGSIHGSVAVLQGKFQSYDFDFIRDISIDVIDPVDPTNRAEIFYLDVVDVNNPVELQLFPSLPNVKDIVSNDLVALEIRYNLRRSPPGNVEGLLTFSLTAFETE